MKSIKGDKNFSASIWSGSASKTTESDFGSGTREPVPENVPSVHMFHKVHFFIALSEICPLQPHVFFISEGGK